VHLQYHVIEAWKASGQAPISIYAPYAAHALHVEIFFYLCLGADLISHARPSHKADMAYLYYLPFCNLFVSNDKLHEMIVPLFLRDGQEFLLGTALKAELAKLDAHYSLLPESVRAQGTMRFAPRPPSEGDFLTARLWDRYHPGWNKQSDVGTEHWSPEEHKKMLKILKAKMKPAPEGTPINPPEGELSSLVLERKVPVGMGKWRILPPGLENSEAIEEDE
jgi:hypothetical protein